MAAATFEKQLAKFEKKGPTVSDRLRRFWTAEVAGHAGKLVGGLPSYTRDTQLKVKFLAPGFGLFEENEVDRDESPTMVPLAELGEEPQFLAVDFADPAAPVAMWEHEDGQFHPVWASLDQFLTALVAKGHVPPIKQLEAAVKKARGLHEREANDKALVVLEPVLRGFPIGGDDPLDGHQGDIGEAWSLLGLILGDLERPDDAIAAYRNGIACGSDYAALNLLGLHEDAGRPEDVVKVADELLESGWLQTYPWYWARRYLATAHVRLGNAEQAELRLRQILDRFAKAEPDKIQEIRAELAELTAAPDLVASLLTWFTPPSYERSAEENAANRTWWKAVPEELRAALIEAAGVEEPVDDLALARIVDLEKLDLDEDLPIDDPTPFAHLRLLERLEFHGAPDSLEALRGLAKLERVEVNGKVIRDLRLPTRKNDALFAAVARNDRKGIAAALAAGADVTAKDDEGRSVLFQVRLGDDVADEDQPELLVHLVELGADLHANHDHGEETILGYLGDEALIARLEAAWTARGGTSPESPWRILTFAHERHDAEFGRLDGLPDDVDVDREDPLPELPAGVWVGMRSNYSGYKKDTELRDFHLTHPDRLPIVSERLRAILVANGVDAPMHPIGLRDHAGRPLDARYFLVHPPAIDVLDHERSEPTYNHIDPESVTEVGRLALHEDRVPATLRMFRVLHHDGDIVVRKELAEVLAGAGLTGVRFSLPKR